MVHLARLITGSESVQNIYSEGIVNNPFELLGNVPIVRTLKLYPEICRSSEVLLKLEGQNLGGSIKEKNAYFLVENAEREGLLNEGGTIIDSSSGNFGVGLAMVGALKNYRVIIVIDQKTTPFFKKLMKAYGAELVEVPLSEMDENGSMQIARMKKAQDLVKQTPGAWYSGQHLNPQNPLAHSYYTAKEIEQSFRGKLDAIIVGVSTGGQIMGIANYYKPRYPHVEIIGVDVAGSKIFSQNGHHYKMTGVGLSFEPPNLKKEKLNGAYIVSESLSYSICQAMAKKEGLLLGASSGAIIAAGLNLTLNLGPSSRVLMVIPDRGDRYLETVYNPEWLNENHFEIFSSEEIKNKIRDLTLIRF